MTSLFALQFVLVAFTAGLAGLAISALQPFWKKVVALALCVGVIGTGYIAAAELLGRPRPSHLASIVSTDMPVTVVASLLRENEAIFLWLLRDEASEPLAVVLAWNIETAKKLRQANADAEAQGTGVQMSRRSGTGQAEGEWVFHARPVDKLPPKESP